MHSSRVACVDFVKALLVALLVNVTLTATAEEIVFVNDSTPYCPYTTCDSGKAGYVLDVVNAIYSSRGYTVKIINVPWNRAIAMVNAGRANGILGITKNSSPGLVYPRTDIARYTPSVFSLVAKDWTYDGVNSLKNVRLGMVENYGNGEGNPELASYLDSKPANVTYIASDDAVLHLFMMIEASRIDALIEDQSVGNYILQKTGKKYLFKSVKVQTNNIAGYVGFRPNDKKSQQLADEFDDGMAALRKSGQLKIILASYGLYDWQR